VVEAGEVGGLHRAAQLLRHLQLAQAGAEVAQGLGKSSLPGSAGVVELPPDLGGRVEQADLMPALGQRGGCGQPGRAGAHHGDLAGVAGAAGSYSRQASGLTRQEAALPAKM
jgi:hypothetical protein